MVEIQHHKEQEMFVLVKGGEGIGSLSYTRCDHTFSIDSIFIQPLFRNNGYGERLLLASIAYSCTEGLRIKPICSYAVSYLALHPIKNMEKSEEKKMSRTHNCSELRLNHVGETVTLKGWVAKERNLGGLIFIDLRDRFGVTQVVIRPEHPQYETAKAIRSEYVVSITGTVIERESKNNNIVTGEIEVVVDTLTIINKSKTTPLIIADETDALEDTRLKYRYLDLRRPAMQQKLFTRHKIVQSIRNFLNDADFIDIETPTLTKSTPEGARDYLVPSRVNAEQFYALPQSPQIFKQLLMISGFDRYYQIARCYRDEDLRADRQPEFTQVDMEMSFMSETEIRSLLEDMLIMMMKEVKGIDIPKPFPVMTYETAMNEYGSDKPDTRFDMKLVDLTSFAKTVDFKVFTQAAQVKAIVAKGAANNYSRKDIDKLTEFVGIYGAKGLAWLKVANDTLAGPIAKFFSEEQAATLLTNVNATNDDLILFVADEPNVVADSLGALRLRLGKELNLIPAETYNFLWVIDWPLFEYDADNNRHIAAHHPFTMPKSGDIDMLATDPGSCLAQAYDVVLNGFEIGGGSIRINNPEIQRNMFRALGFSDEQMETEFGFLIDAYEYGAPEHGGVALGLDRIAMILTNSDSIRDVIAFPKTASARDLMMDAPSHVSDKQLEELHIQLRK